MDPLSLSSSQWAVAGLAAWCLGTSKTGFSGLSLLGVVLVAEVWPARESTGLVLPLLVLGDVCAVLSYRRHARWGEVRRLLLPTLIGVGIGYELFLVLPAAAFRPAIGAVVLALVILQARQRWELLVPAAGRRSGAGPAPALAAATAGAAAAPVAAAPESPHLPPARWLAWSLGTLAGATTMLANAAGPVMTIYLLVARLPKYEFLGTGAWFFLLLNVGKLPFSASLGVITPRSLLVNLCLAPAVLLGALTGRWLLGIVSQVWFERLTLLLSGAAALRLLAG